MLSIERQGIIKNILLEHKSVSVADLTERFGVSFETIRRDLKVLEKEGMIEKTYGGAVLKQKVMNPADYQTLSHIMVDSKRKMALRAVRLLVPGDCIYIGFSSTWEERDAFFHWRELGWPQLRFSRTGRPGQSDRLSSGQGVHLLPGTEHGGRDQRQDRPGVGYAAPGDRMFQ